MTPKRRRGGWTGRAFLIGALLFVAALVVVWRRTRGEAVQRHVAALEAAVQDLDAREKTLRGELRTLSAEGRIRREAARRLGLGAPREAQLVDLERETAP